MTTSQHTDDSVGRDFIEVYPDALSPELCDRIIEAFEESKAQGPGRTGGGVDPTMKKSVDVFISDKPEWREIEAELVAAASRCLVEYVRTYPHTLLAPMMFQRTTPDGTTTRITSEEVRAMSDRDVIQMAGTALRPGGINVQRYTADEGGYPYWHCETMPTDSTHEALHRHCLWTVYLNDTFDEGGTEFLYQGHLVEPRKGALLIAPAAFTHTHRGNMPKGGDKYIATSWFLFHRK